MKKYQLSLTDELHRKLKSKASMQGKTLQDLITEILEAFVKRGGD